MDKLIIEGGGPLKGEITVSGAKNVALKAMVAALLTDEEIEIKNVPLISDIFSMISVLKSLGVKVEITKNHIMKIKADKIKSFSVPLELGAQNRTAVMIIAPFLARFGQATIPNPGGCRIGARPIDRHVEGLKKMGASIEYNHKDGFFHGKAKKLTGVDYHFLKNTHTGTETLVLAAVLAQGDTVLENAACEPEVDDLIRILNQMGAKIERVGERKIVIHGVKKLHGVSYKIMPDRNEAVTFAIAGLITQGDVTVSGTERENMRSFLAKLDKIGAGWEPKDQNTTRFYYKGNLKPIDIETRPHPSFMTDWQAPWAALMTQVNGASIIHETVYEDRFAYVFQLLKMGAEIEFFNPKINNPQDFYNFNWSDNKPEHFHAIRILGPTKFHNGILEISDLRAGATLVLASLAAKGKSVISGVEHLDRGYENFEKRLRKLGAKIKRIKNFLN